MRNPAAQQRLLRRCAYLVAFPGKPLAVILVAIGISDEIIRTALGFIVHLVDVIGVSLNLSLPHPMRPFAHPDYAAVGLLTQGDM